MLLLVIGPRPVFNIPTTVARSSSNSSKPSLASSFTAVATTVINTQQVDVDTSDPEYVKIKADLDKIGRKMTRLVKLNNTILIENFETESAHLKKIKKQPGWLISLVFCLVCRLVDALSFCLLDVL